MQSTRASSTYGGLGLAKPSELSSLEYEASVTVTEQHIVAHNYQLPDAVDMQSSKSQAGAKKNEVLKGSEEVVKSSLSPRSESVRVSVGKGCLKLAHCNTHKRSRL